MRRLISLLFVLSLGFQSSGFADDPSQAVCLELPPSKVVQGLGEAVKKVANEYVGPMAELQNLAAKNSGGAKAVVFLTEPSEVGCQSVKYNLPDTMLNPKEAIYLHVPPALRNRAVNFVALGHRQREEDGPAGGPGAGKHDDKPGYTSVQIHSADNKGDSWRYWGGQASGPQGGKFAEWGNRAELENLYEWQTYGHHGVETGDYSKAELHPDAVRLISNGSDPVIISQLILKVHPEKADKFVEGVFLPGTKIGDPQTGEGREYGGGQGFKGKFHGAVTLGGWNQGGSQLPANAPSGWKVVGNELRIPLSPGSEVINVEIACGDSHPDEAMNSDGGMGSKGHGRLSVGIQHYGEPTEWSMKQENVPPEGVMMSSPKECGQKARPGDMLVIRGEKDAVYLMAVRVGLKK
ncbi:hypothetical protein WDW86_10795 [Bdellovibrionota bacterium FG-2]